MKALDVLGTIRTNWTTRLLGVGALSVLIVFLRQTDAFTYPQFWAEDAPYLYAPPLNEGLGSVLSPYAGSLQTLLRLGGFFAAQFPLSWGPSIFLLIAVFFQILPILLIHSRRFKPVFPNVGYVWLLTIFYLFQPNTSEIHANLTTANWHIALSAFLLIIAPATRSKLMKIFDLTIIILAGLTGPFAFFLLPVAGIKYFYSRDKQVLHKLILLSACCFIQFIALLGMKNASVFDPGMIFTHTKSLVAVIGTQIPGVSLLGSETLIGRMNVTATIWLTLLFIMTVVTAFIISNLHLRLFILFGSMMLLASMFRSQDGDLEQLWGNFIMGHGDRYFFIPSLMWFASLIYLLKSKFLIIRSVAFGTLIPILFIAIPADLTFSPKMDSGYYSFVKEFNKISPGTKLCHESNPETPANTWEMCITKQ